MNAQDDRTVIIYVSGGITYAELAALQSKRNEGNHNIVIGSSEIITATEYLESLAASEGVKLSKSRKKSKKQNKQINPSSYEDSEDPIEFHSRK